MTTRRSPVGVSLVAALALLTTACLGGKRDSDSTTTGVFQVQVTPPGLIIPAGGGGFVTVTTTRPLPHFLNYQGPLTVSLEGAPTGVLGSGTISADHANGTLSLWVDGSVAPQTLQGLRVKVAGGGAETDVPFQLTVAPPLPPGQLRADLVQASGGAQQGGTMANTPVVQEPVAATPATDAAKVETVRHAFLPTVPTSN